jgi:very-short-patch-repair endonuclease
VDLKDLDLLVNKGDASLASSFVSNLLDPEKSAKLNVPLDVKGLKLSETTEDQRFKTDVLFKRFQSINFDKGEDFLEHGTKSFGFGYPLIAFKSKQDKTRTLLAPLLIWFLDIAPQVTNHHAFTLSRTDDAAIVLNPQLMAYLQSDAGIVLEQLPEEYADDDCIDETELSLLMQKLVEQLNAEIVNWDEGVVAMQDKAYYERLVDEKPLIFNAGLFSVFKSNKESIVADYQQLISGGDDMMFDDPNLYLPYQEDYFSAVPLDPSQEGILRNITEHKKVIIQGPPGTGKSNSLTGIILNALENQARVLVVCEKKTALDILFENLKEKGLEEFCVVIDNVHSDRQKVVRAIRDKFDSRNYETSPIQGLVAYRHNKEQFVQSYSKATAKYHNLMSTILGDMTWKDCIGYYLKFKRESKQEALIKLNFQNVTLDETLFYFLLEQVKQAAYLKEQVNEVYKILDPLNDNLFKEPLNTQFVRDTQGAITKLLQDLKGNQAKWEALSQQHKDLDKLMHPKFMTKLLSFFQAPLKQALKDIQLVFTQAKEMEKSASNILNHKPLKSQNTTEWMVAIEQLIAQLKEIDTVFSHFRNYHAWKKFYLESPKESAQKLIDALESVPYSEWESTYRAWFLNEILLSFELSLGDFPTDDRDLEQLFALESEIDKMQMQHIRALWYAIQRETVKGRTLQELRMLFNLRGNKTFNKRNSLRQLYFDEFELMTSFYPVLFVNPSVCSSMLPLKPGIFDLVVFDEASQLRLEDTFPALLRGRFKIVSGDIHQMPPSTHFSSQGNTVTDLESLEDDVVFSEEESLLTYAQNADFEFNYLDFHYRSQHPFLIDFSNAAFYGKRLVPMPPTSKVKPIEFREVNGLYDNNTNQKEAEEILKLLFEEIQPGADGAYPSIGIATLNMTQQRFIWEMIWDRADQDEAIRQKLVALEESGFFIKNLENIQGDQRDIIIISTTFGVRPDGKFIQNFGPLNRDTGYKMLNVIVTRAKYKLYVVSSVPRSFYQEFRDELITKGNTGKGIFYAYLNYVRFCDEGNEEARIALLDFLSSNQGEEVAVSQSPENFLTESPFEEEVLHELLQFVPANVVQTQFQLGGFRLDIVLTDKDFAPQIVIECDGKTYHKSQVAHRYDMHRQRILERHGLKVYRIWSTNWWRNKNAETQKIKDYLQTHMPHLFVSSASPNAASV